MKQDRHITTQITHGCSTRTTVGRPKTRATKAKPPVNFGPELNLRGPQGPGDEARALAELRKADAQAAYNRATANGAKPKEAVRLIQNAIRAAERAVVNYEAELLNGSHTVQIG